MRLLLIEPSALLRERLAAMLANLGCAEILGAGSVEEAARSIPVRRPDIVIVDAGLPDRSALDALAWARAECPLAWLVVVSAHSAELYRKRWLQAGADDFFDLSTQIDGLVKRVRHCCRTQFCSAL
jgi:DNA-binding NarL/FixJ family response regulator